MKLASQGYEEAVIHQMRKSNTNLLLEEIIMEAVHKALLGITGSQIERYKEEYILHAFSLLAIQDVEWMIMSTM